MPNYEEYRGRNASFINPFNFVSVDLKNESYDIDKRKNIEDVKGKHSGVLKCRLIARTPIAVPDTSKVLLMGRNNKHKGYYFMRTPDGKPMIPGSSLRGVIRSTFETVTDSCFLTTDETRSITNRTKGAFKAGLLYKNNNGEIQLYNAERYIFAVKSEEPIGTKRDGTLIYNYAPDRRSQGKTLEIKEKDLAGYSYGQPVRFRPAVGSRTKKDKNGKEYPVGKYIQNIYPIKSNSTKNVNVRGIEDGYICIGEPFSGKKHFESVFCKKALEKLPTSPGGVNPLDKAVKDLEEILKIYNDERININAKNGRKFYQGRDYTSISNGSYLPVWYTIDSTNNSVYLSVASIGRFAYKKTMGNMLGKHKRCTSRENACPACRLFGMVGDKSLGTRVRISDACMDKRVQLGDLIPLKELAGPKISYLPFYLRNSQNTKDSWNYDSNSVTLAGRKYYWHNTADNAYKEYNEKKQMGERNSSMELMGVNSSFCFEVYFNGLTETELDQLIWTITLGDNREDSDLCHKIGHGKPIGLGSAKIIIESGVERAFGNGEYRVSPITINVKDEQRLGFDQNALTAIKQISDLKACSLPVTYPAVVDNNGRIYNDSYNNHASHQWFSNNYSIGKTPHKVLPPIGEQNNQNKSLRYVKEMPNRY